MGFQWYKIKMLEQKLCQYFFLFWLVFAYCVWGYNHPFLYKRGWVYMFFLEVCAKVIPLGFGFFFSLKYQGTPCSMSFQLFFSREIGQMFLRRGRYSKAGGPKHWHKQHHALKHVISSLLPCHYKSSVHLFPVYNMQSPTWFFSLQLHSPFLLWNY